MKLKYIRVLITASLFMGLLAFNPSTQASDPSTIPSACIFFNKVVYHLTTDLITNSGVKLLANDVREVIIQGRFKTPANTPTNVTTALFTALCGNDLSTCIHKRDNTKIDSVELAADCVDSSIKKLTTSNGL